MTTFICNHKTLFQTIHFIVFVGVSELVYITCWRGKLEHLFLTKAKDKYELFKMGWKRGTCCTCTLHTQKLLSIIWNEEKIENGSSYFWLKGKATIDDIMLFLRKIIKRDQTRPIIIRKIPKITIQCELGKSSCSSGFVTDVTEVNLYPIRACYSSNFWYTALF